MFIVGIIAEGGGDLTVVTLFELLFTVDSVTIGCALAKPNVINAKTIKINFLLIFAPYLLTFL